MRSRLFFVLLLLAGSTSLMAQTSYTDYLDQKFARPHYDETTIVDRWDAAKTIDSYKINVSFVKYSDGSYDVVYEDKIMKTTGYMDVDCSYVPDQGNDKIRCDYVAYNYKTVDTSSWWAPATTYTYDELHLSGFFTLEHKI